MNVLFVPSIGLDTSLIERLATSVDYPVKWKVVLNNGPTGALERFREQNRDWIVREPAVGNRGVAGSWNDCAKMFPDEPAWLLMNEDARFLPGQLEQMCKCMDENPDAPVVHINDSNAYYCFGATKIGRDKFGEFDENFWPAYCLAPETLILTDDLRWKQIGLLKVGESLVGVEEFKQSAGGRKYISTQVKFLKLRKAQSVKIVMKDGRHVVCSLEHKWLSKLCKEGSDSAVSWKWCPSSSIRPGWRIYAPFRSWGEDSSFDVGWLSGAFDGEGSYMSRGLAFYQKPGLVLDRAIEIIRSMGIGFTIYHEPDCSVLHICKKKDCVELIARLRSVRLFPSHRRLWEGRFIQSQWSNADLVVSEIEPIGIVDVVSIETTTHTFIANGLISHNCEDCDMRVRHRLGGVTIYPYAMEGQVPVPHGKPRDGGVNYSAMIQGAGLLNRAYWFKKWGGVSCEQAVYQTPYKDQRLTVRDVVWMPQHRAELWPLWREFINQPNPSLYD